MLQAECEWQLLKEQFPWKQKFREKKIVGEILSTLGSLGCNLCVNIQFTFSRFQRFPKNLGYVSDEQGQHLYQDIKVMVNIF